MFKLGELININFLKKIADNIYALAGIHMSICDTDGNLLFAVGQVEICNKFHRANPITCNRCYISDRYVNNHIGKDEYIEYKCLNNIRDIAMPIVISGIHIATIFFGQFFYEDEVIDIEYFRAQALEFGFNEKEYLDALSRIPILSKDKVKYIMEYYKALVMTLAESGLRLLEYENSQKELEKSQKYLNTIFNSVNDAIFIGDLYGNILDVNETATSMFGYSRNELTNMKISDMSLYNSLNNEEIFNKIENDVPFKMESFCISTSNREFWVEGNIRTINIDGEKRVISVMRDVTERKQNELKLRLNTKNCA